MADKTPTAPVAISVQNISKTFKLPHEKQSSIKSSLLNLRRHKKGFERQHVLDNINFEIKKGEFFGIVGRNGSGKSTLLKLIAGIYSPSAGHIQVNGQLTPFIELGVGFNPELTGQENVYLNGALLGFSRKEVAVMYDDIVEFAELERFMDQKLKNYSSGMQVRLAFSISIRAKSDILLLDEVLAVGDEAFQRKCIEIFETLKANKQTIILVTHDMAMVRRFCNNAILIDKGQIIAQGEPNKIATRYSRLNREVPKAVEDVEVAVPKSSIKIATSTTEHKPASEFRSGETMHVNVTWPDSLKNVQNVGVAIIKNSGEFMFGANTLEKPLKLDKRTIDFEVNLDLGPGKYYIMAGLFGETRYDIVDFLDRGPDFTIPDNIDDETDGMVRLNYKWIEKT